MRGWRGHASEMLPVGKYTHQHAWKEGLPKIRGHGRKVIPEARRKAKRFVKQMKMVNFKPPFPKKIPCIETRIRRLQELLHLNRSSTRLELTRDGSGCDDGAEIVEGEREKGKGKEGRKKKGKGKTAERGRGKISYDLSPPPFPSPFSAPSLALL